MFITDLKQAYSAMTEIYLLLEEVNNSDEKRFLILKNSLLI
jgi:hypothetical protein